MPVSVGMPYPTVTWTSLLNPATPIAPAVRAPAAGQSAPDALSPGSATSSVQRLTGGGGDSAKITYTQAITIENGNIVTTKLVWDDGAGLIPEANGDVNYVTGRVYFKPTGEYKHQKYENSRSDGTGTWQQESNSDSWGDGSLVRVTYRPDSVIPQAASETMPTVNITINLTPHTQDGVVPGSVQFSLGGKTYIDREGSLYRDVDPVTGAGTLSGSIDYNAGKVTLTDWYAAGGAGFTLESLLTYRGQWDEWAMMFRTPGSPLQTGSFTLAVTDVNGNLLTGTTDANGNITGDNIQGTVNQEVGIVDLLFGETVPDSSLTAEEKAEHWYDPADVDGQGNIFKPRRIIPPTARFNTVILVWLPLDAEILGLDPVRLPLDGRVPIFRTGYVVVVHHTDEITGVTPTPAGTVDLTRDRISRVKVIDVDGVTLDPAQYTVDLDDGVLTWANPPDLTGTTGPYTIQHTVEDMALCTDVQINGTLTLSRAISHTFPATETKISSALILGDLWAHYGNLFSQATWTGVWSDAPIGSGTTGQYNETIYPIIVTNNGAITERWRIEFTSTTAFKVVGETVGQIAIGDINTNLTPTNPATSAYYFTVDYRGWGSGWIAGNVVRFNTYAAHDLAWITRTIEQGTATAQSDQFRLQIRGDIDQ